LLATSPPLKMASQRAVKMSTVGFTNVDSLLRAVTLPLLDHVHTGLAVKCAHPVRVALAGRSDGPIDQPRVAQLGRTRCVDLGAALVGTVLASSKREERDDRGYAPREHPGQCT